MRYWVIWVIMSKATKNKYKADKIRLIILEHRIDKERGARIKKSDETQRIH